ncbi:MAG TPA: TonB family protein [Candidatus Baltobacteraceae bacterium]|nr:TonB family protein [Candidatus Baltobacteraceae bacterium]
MKVNVHDRIEAIAGAIALGEASDEERREYREHIAACRGCLDALGGEREIERVAATVPAARDQEVWEPDVRNVVEARLQRRSQKLRYGFGLFGVALAASFGVHALFAAGIPRVSTGAAAPVVINAGPTRIVLEQNPATAKPAPAAVAAAPRRLIVTHNVVQIARAPMPAAANPVPAAASNENKPRQLVAITVHPQPVAQPVQHAKIPVWHRNDTAWTTVARTTTTSLTETAPQTLTHSAESIQVAPNYSREVAPVGGETAINPQPPMIAYDEGAEGTTAFEVLVDEHGTPTKCVITKSAGYPVLDDTVCKAAMKARYTPKIVDGRAVPGTYHDAFTFHMSDQTSMNSEGLPHVPSAVSAVPTRRQINQGQPQTTNVTAPSDGQH